MNKKSCLIVQSGAMGDIFVIAPIAHYYYRKGFEVFWPVRKQYFNFVSEYLFYVNALAMPEHLYPQINEDWLRSDTMHILQRFDKKNIYVILNLADRGEKPEELPGETFEETKYRLAGIPFLFKNHLIWNNNQERENEIVKIVQQKYNINIDTDSYVVAHLESSHGDKAEMPNSDNSRTVVEITQHPGIEIADWFPVIIKAQAIYCVESSVHQFIDGAIHSILYFNPKIKFYLLSRSSLKPGQSYTKSVNWDKKYMK